MKIRWHASAACFAATLISALYISTISPALPQLTSEFGLGLSDVGLFITLQFIGFTVFTLISGLLADKLGKPLVLKLALLMLVLSTAAFSLAPSLLVNKLALVFMGGGMGVLETMGNALLSDVNPTKRTFFINFNQVFFGLGAVIGPALFGIAFAAGISWRTVYMIMSGVVAVFLIYFCFVRFPKAAVGDKLELRGIGKLFTDKRFLLIALSMALYTGAESSAWGFMSTYTEEQLAFSTLASAIVVAVFWGSVTVGRFAVSLMLKKVDSRRLLLVLAASAALVTAAMAFVREGASVYIVTVLLGLACSSQWSLVLSYGAERYRSSTGTVFAILTSSGSIGASVLPLLMGFAGELFGIRISLAVPAVGFMLIVLAFLVIERKKRGFEQAPKSE